VSGEFRERVPAAKIGPARNSFRYSEVGLVNVIDVVPTVTCPKVLHHEQTGSNPHACLINVIAKVASLSGNEQSGILKTSVPEKTFSFTKTH